MSEAITLEWRKSSRSGGGSNDACIEVAFVGPAVAVRDSKSPGAGRLVFPMAAWVTLSSGIRPIS